MNNKLIVGYDTNGIVYDNDSSIVRKVIPSYFGYAKEIFDLYKKYNLEKIGIVTTQIDQEKTSFQHQKHIISYPFEWTVDMFKDAALFHLDLFLELDKHGLTLKDGIPNNIVFDSTNPVFVDFLSIIKKQDLEKEQWLTEGKKSDDYRFLVFDKMFTPFILIPFLVLANRNVDSFREILANKACNLNGNTPIWSDVKPKKQKFRLKKFIKQIFSNQENAKAKTCQIKKLIKLKEKLNFIDFVNKLKTLIQDIDVTIKDSAYSSYYKEKKEAYNFQDKSNWQNKQLSVFKALKESHPKTVLDLGANTGWFSILAESLGAKVIAVEIDEASINNLYLYSKQNKYNILPLRLIFQDLEKSAFGTMPAEEIYKDRDFKNNPLFLPANERLKCDTVLCLALIHHLILGLGIEISEVMRILATLTNSTLVVEYVGFEDQLIKTEPSFFPNIGKFSSINYNMDIIIAEGKKYFSTVEILDSHPETRKIFVFKK